MKKIITIIVTICSLTSNLYSQNGFSAKNLFMDSVGLPNVIQKSLDTTNFKIGVFDANGYMFKMYWPSSGSSYTASNGLTLSTNDFQLGGTLTGNTTITGGGNFMIFTGTSSATVTVNNTSTGGALSVQSGAGTGIGVSSTTGDAISALNTATTGVANMTSNPSSTNTDVSVLTLTRNTSGTAANNIAASLRFNLQTSTTGGTEANRIISKWTDVTHATRTSQFIITGVNSGTTGDILTLNGNKSIQLNGYGSGTFTGTPTKTLQVDASGNIIEGALTTSGTYTPTAANTTNVASTGAFLCHYSRMGNEVHVSGKIQVTATAANTTTTFTLTLPTSTANFSSDVQAAGNFQISNGSVSAGGINYAAIGGQVVWFSYYAPNTSAQDLYFNFTYTIQ